ncbi:MAG: PACE efflux transporter [Desulfobulbaceae bacterium]|nr:PACE efflux transporter [Desulfobulbaceae bacterium]
MRTTTDRVRHSFLFELLGVILCTPLASLILGKSLAVIGSLSITISIVAMGINYLFNLLFDKAMVRLGQPVNVRPVWLRILHAMSFEASLLVLTIPMVAWWLDMSLWAAFIADIGFVVFFLIYAFVFNWTYDTVFPMPMCSK